MSHLRRPPEVHRPAEGHESRLADSNGLRKYDRDLGLFTSPERRGLNCDLCDCPDEDEYSNSFFASLAPLREIIFPLSEL